MKKLIFLCVALLVAPAMAVVEFSFDDNGDNTMTISYNCVDVDSPRGIALHLQVTSGDGMITGYEMGSASDKMNCFIDYAYSTDPYNLGEGHPLADPAGPGALDASGGVTEVSICMGALDQTEQQLPGDPAGVVATLTYTGSGLLTISADTLRGPDSGVVGSELASNLPLVDKEFGSGPPPCLTEVTAIFPAGHPRAGQSYYQEWLDVGSPDCWCYARQCWGDADGLMFSGKWVLSPDLGIFLGAWNKDVGAEGFDICADFDHALFSGKRVLSPDLAIFLASWNQDGIEPNCGGTLEP